MNLEIGRERTSRFIVLKNNLSNRFEDSGILFQCRRYIAVVTKELDRTVEEFLEVISGHKMIQGFGFVGRCQDDQISKLPLKKKKRQKLALNHFRQKMSSP